MKAALAEARKAAKAGEVPVGAVAVRDGKRIASAHNRPISLNDPTAHAEILCLRRASKKLRNYRLNGIILYVTKEPCAMCRGALVWARVERVVWGCPDIKPANHKFKITRGVCKAESARLLKGFFKHRR
ncbi:MAG: hypothetical protein A3A86_02035 [Elusimicrobia bacterium RIFCSPLOWO2_01_FULL_60_11]|nr:MAG: hypothetical protein A3A86_02035 [Elusimicrobia bacterium RIFCSPLOWO2_01_FULL_60_11]